MTVEQRRGSWSALLVRAVIGLACATAAACGTAESTVRKEKSIHATGKEMNDAMEAWLKHMSPEDRAVIDELMERDDVEIHLVLAPGKLRPEDSRGGSSTVGQGEFVRKICPNHNRQGVAWTRFWHIAYDPVLTKKFEDEHGVPTPIDVVLQHEMFGHVLYWLARPELLAKYAKAAGSLVDPTEPRARAIENDYRERNGDPKVQEEWFRRTP